MISQSPTPLTGGTVFAASGRDFLPSLCWRAIIGGTVAAIGIHILLSALGVGAGLATFAPLTDANPAASFSVGAALVWSLCALVALAFGGFVAGRFSQSVGSGFVHGVLVWSLTLIITVLLLSMGTGMILGGALNVVGQGLGVGGKAVAAGLGDTAKEGVKRAGDQLVSFIDEGVQSGPTNVAPNAATRAKREIGFAMTKFFAPGNDITSQDNRAAAIKALTNHANMNEADATKTIDAWSASYKELKSELDKVQAAAEQKAKAAADRAAHNLSIAGLWSFFGLLLGLLVTSFSGSCGAKWYLRSIEPIRDVGGVVIDKSTSRAA